MPLTSPFAEDFRQQRRQILKAFGWAVPSAVLMDKTVLAVVPNDDEAASAVHARDIYELFVADVVKFLPEHMGWYLWAFDLDKKAGRTFALADVHSWRSE
jgi:hypothetical protein